jgi:hypothetical protein
MDRICLLDFNEEKETVITQPKTTKPNEKSVLIRPNKKTRRVIEEKEECECCSKECCDFCCTCVAFAGIVVLIVFSK